MEPRDTPICIQFRERSSCAKARKDFACTGSFGLFSGDTQETACQAEVFHYLAERVEDSRGVGGRGR